jgi:uncharacterized protein (TIGR03083 family)
MRSERRDIRELLIHLRPEQWQEDSLCAGWSVRDLVAHLVAWDDVLLYRTWREHFVVLARFVNLYVTSLASMRIVNRRLQRRTQDLDASALIERFGADDGAALKWLFDGTNPAAHLAEYVIHHEDIRRPLGLHRRIPAERLVPALDGVLQLPGVRVSARWRLRRTRVEATDVGWVKGRGRAEAMTGTAALLWLSGRRSGADDGSVAV